MNFSETSLKEVPELHSPTLKIKKEESYVRKQTTIAGNKIILEMPDSTFFEGEKIVGTVILDLRTKLNIKRINIQVIGELSYVIRESISTQNEKMLNLNNVLKNYKKSSSLAGIQRQKTSNFRPMNTYTKATNIQQTEVIPIFHPTERKLLKSPSNKIVPALDTQRLTPKSSIRMTSKSTLRSKTLEQSKSLPQRAVTRSNTKINNISRQSTQATTEVFCHYLVPIFQLKRRIQPGKYDFPFSFSFVKLHAPSVDLSWSNFRLKTKYTLIAEVEENPDDDSFAEEDEMDEDGGTIKKGQKKNLKCLANLEIFWDYKKHLDDTDPYSENPAYNRWNFKIPRCCFLKHDVTAEINVPKTIFIEGDLIPFTVKLQGAPNANDVDIRVDLFEEVSNNLIQLRDTSATGLSMRFRKELVDGKLVMTGDFDLGTRVTGHSLRSEDWNVSHTLDFYIKMKGFLSKREEKYTLPVLIIPQMYQRRESKKLMMIGTASKVIDQQSDERLTLVFSKFKLEDRYDIIRNHHFTEAAELDDYEEEEA